MSSSHLITSGMI
ncbi:hypothetical protein CSPAE12_06029 [Colletotrichum incanum]|nr:hypothetical protein CSPAE12_06029 [Colletotrichum incanum]